MKFTDWVIQLIVLLHLSIVGIFSPEVAMRAKRMLFLTSLATELAKEGIVKRNVLDTLNSDLKLARNDRCLLLGKEISKHMWRHKSLGGGTLSEGIGLQIPVPSHNSEGWDGRHDLKPEVSNFLSLSDIRTLNDKVMTATPKWVKYDSAKMREDMTDFFVTNPIINRVSASV